MNLGREDEKTEFKKSTSELKEGMDSICAILNKHGSGVLYFGVRNDGEVVGQEISGGTLREISQAIGYSIAPAVRPTITEKFAEDGKSYVEVAFSGSDAPYSSNGRFRIRVADEDKLMTPSEVRTMVLDTAEGLSSWDSRPSGKTIDNIDKETLREYIGKGNACGRIGALYEDEESTLTRLGLIATNGQLTNAAAILFCRSQTPMLKMGVLASRDRVDILDVQQAKGTLFELAHQAEFYILSNIRRRVVIDGSGLERKEIPELPMEAIREAILNAFTHADYRTNEALQIDIYANSVEIYNPGWFLDDQLPEKHLSGEDKRSKSRNPLISQCLFKSKHIESYGTGMPRIKRLCDEANIQIEYLKVPGGTRVVFHRNEPFANGFGAERSPHGNVTEVGRSWPKLAEVGRSWPKLAEVGRDPIDELSEKERSIYLAALQKGAISTTFVVEELEIAERTARRILASLTEKGLLIPKGETNNRTYAPRQTDDMKP